MSEKSVFEVLNSINVNEHVEEKNGFKYVSWAWAWAEVKKHFPDAEYKVYENPELFNMPYFSDKRTCFVKTGVTINGLEHIEYLPVMDYRNNSIPYEKVTSYDINKSIQRSLTKAVARHGLGLYIYAGEDLPEDASKDQERRKQMIDPKLINEAQKNGVDIDKLAKYLKKEKNELTNEEIMKAIKTKQKAAEQKAQVTA